MQKRLVLLIVTACCALPVWGQQAASDSIRVSTAVETPESNIDLLKQSLQTSPKKDSVVGVSKPAVPPVPTNTQPAVTPKAAASATPAATLDMPLEMSGQVQTVKTTVAPAQKPAASKTSKGKRTKSASKNVSATSAKTVKATQPDKQAESEQPEENTEQTAPDTSNLSEEDAADAELEYAVKMLEESKAKANSQRPIPPSAAQNKPSKVPAPNKKFNPNAFRPNVTWLESKSTHFDIYTQKRKEGIPSSNMSMTFEQAYQTLRRFIPWMLAGRVRVFIYQDHQSYLRHEPNAKAWTRAMAYPTRGEIVVYDEPGKQRELQEVFTHELTHIFTQQFFDSHKTGRIMTPTWLDEGLAVFMEDQAAGGAKGGPWSNDLKTLNFQPNPSNVPPSFGSSTLFSLSFRSRLKSKKEGNPVYLVAFEEFMEEDSLPGAEGRNQVQNWYFQAYAMVRFLLNPAGGSTPSNRMQFEQFTRLISQGEAKRDPSTGFLVKDSRGKTVYEPYSVEKALGRAFRYNSIANFEDNFWHWAGY